MLVSTTTTAENGEMIAVYEARRQKLGAAVKSWTTGLYEPWGSVHHHSDHAKTAERHVCGVLYEVLNILVK